MILSHQTPSWLIRKLLDVQKSRRTAAEVLCWIAVLVLGGFQVGWLAERGPLSLSAPRTVVSNGPAAIRSVEPLLVFLRDVGQAVPPNATLSLRTSSSQPDLDTLIAVGQLPGHRVVPEYATGPAYVAAFRTDFRDASYRVVRRYRDGELYLRWRD